MISKAEGDDAISNCSLATTSGACSTGHMMEWSRERVTISVLSAGLDVRLACHMP